jgi:hypothetical protein
MKSGRSSPLPWGEAGPLAGRVRGESPENIAYYPSPCPSPYGRGNAVAPFYLDLQFFHTLESGNPIIGTRIRLSNLLESRDLAGKDSSRIFKRTLRVWDHEKLARPLSAQD